LQHGGEVVVPVGSWGIENGWRHIGQNVSYSVFARKRSRPVEAL
jgi:hypothetical protein